MSREKKGDPLYEVWCECCYLKVQDYRFIDAMFKCEFCISKEEAKILNDLDKRDPTSVTDEEWELPQSTWYKPPGGGENAA